MSTVSLNIGASWPVVCLALASKAFGWLCVGFLFKIGWTLAQMWVI